TGVGARKSGPDLEAGETRRDELPDGVLRRLDFLGRVGARAQSDRDPRRDPSDHARGRLLVWSGAELARAEQPLQDVRESARVCAQAIQAFWGAAPCVYVRRAQPARHAGKVRAPARVLPLVVEAEIQIESVTAGTPG